MTTAASAGDGCAPVDTATSISDRLLRAIPLASAYLWLSIIYLVEAWKHATPWLFTDELELTQISRSIAATGHPAQRGDPAPIHSLYTVITAPFWLFENTQTAYDAVKYFDVLLMTGVMFPAYALARLVVGRRWALFAAVGSTAVPALAYSSWIVEEPLAYPYSTLCLFVFAKTLVELRRANRPRGWIASTVVLALLAPFVRSQLIVIPIILVLTLVFAWWSSDRERTRRSTWSRADHFGVVVLVLGGLFALSAFAGHHYTQWYVVTTGYKHRIFVMGDWALGSLAIGIGIVPLVLGLTALFHARNEERTRELRMFRSVSLAGLIVFWMYAAMKAAYLSTIFATRTEERNLHYITPLLFIGTAYTLERRRASLFWLLGFGAFALYLVCGTPFRMDVQLYSDALGTAIFEQANRYFAEPWTPGFSQWVAIAMLTVCVALALVVVRLPRRPRMAATASVTLALLVVSWGLVGEIAAAAGTVSISRDETPTLGRPFDWVDRATGDQKTIYLGQGVLDQNPEWLLEFWNRSIAAVSSFDGSLQGPGKAGAPNLTPAGLLYWTHDPAVQGKTFAYAVEDWPCIDFAGTKVVDHPYRGGFARPKVWRLVKLEVPNRLRAQCMGIYPDTWTGPTSSYFHYTRLKPQWLRVVVSRKDWGGNTGPSPVHVLYGTVAADVPHYETKLGRVLHRYDLTIDSSQTKTVWIRTTDAPFVVQVNVDKTFVPRDVDPSLSDPRQLGAEVSYELFARRPGRRHTGG